MKKILSFLLALALSVSLVACNSDDGGSKKKDGENVYRDYQTSEAKTLDFNQATDAVSGRYGFNVGERLVLIDSQGVVKPGLAESWEVSDDGLTYTFNMRDQVYVDHEGKEQREVIADDFVNAFNFIVKKDADGEYLTQSSNYVTKYISVKSVEAEDDKTVIITLNKAEDYALSMFANYVFDPRPQDLIDELGGDDKYAVNHETRWYSGPFYISDYESASKVVMPKNESYWNADEIELDRVETKVMVGADPALLESAYNEGHIDYFSLQGDIYSKYEDNEQAQLIDELVVFNIVFNFKPVDANSDMNLVAKHVEARLALAQSYDPQYLIDKVLHGGYTSSYWVPKGFDVVDGNDFRTDTGYEDGYLGYDPAAAKANWDKFKKATGKDTFTLKLLNYDSAVAADSMEYVKQEMEKNLEGLTVVIEPLVFQDKLAKAKKFDFDMNYYGWSPDYINAKAMLTNFETTNTYNEIRFANEEYDKLLASGSREDLIRAEEILIKEQVAMAPVWQRQRPYMVREGLEGLKMYPIGTDFDYRVISVNN